MALKSISTTDIKTWSSPDGAGNPLFQGPSLTVFRGELWGAWICQQEGYENVPFLYKYKDGKMPAWGGNIALNPKWRMIGRLSTTELDDKYYLAYRGASTGKLWIAISATPEVIDSYKLANPGALPAQPGSQVPQWAYSPTIVAFQGSLVLIGADEYNQMYFQVLSSAGVIERPWTAIPQHKTTRSVGLAVYQNELWCLHTAENLKEAWYGKLTSKTGDWSPWGAFSTPNVSSSVSLAVHSDGKLYATWTGSGDAINLASFEGRYWSSSAIQSSAKAAGSSGIGSLGGKLYVAYGQKSTTSATMSGFNDGEGVVIRGGYEGDEEGDETGGVYYEKQEAMQAYQPKWMMSPASAKLPSPASGESPNDGWLSKMFCL